MQLPDGAEWARSLLVGVAVAACGAVTPAPAAEPEDLADFTLEQQAAGALAVLGITAVPSETASTLFLDAGDGAIGFEAAQLGGGFTVSRRFPLYLEGYIGYNRYQPELLLGDGTQTAPLDLNWTEFAATGGIGWDFALTERLTLRPILNVSLGRILSDTVRVADFIADGIGADDADFLRDGGLTAGGFGGSVMLDYNQRWESDLEVDVTLRYTNIRLHPIAGDRDVAGHASAETLALWSRLRMPTGRDAFGGPFRSVAEFSASWLPGDQGAILDTDWLAQAGYGFEIDVLKTWIPVITTGRLMLRYTKGEHLEGYGVGVAVSF